MEKNSCQIMKLLVLWPDPSFFKKRVIEALFVNFLHSYLGNFFELQSVDQIPIESNSDGLIVLPRHYELIEKQKDIAVGTGALGARAPMIL